MKLNHSERAYIRLTLFGRRPDLSRIRNMRVYPSRLQHAGRKIAKVQILYWVK